VDYSCPVHPPAYSDHCCHYKVTSAKVSTSCKPECQQERPKGRGPCRYWRSRQRKDFLLPMLAIKEGL